MATFLLILAGLIIFNFILLKFSIQSVDGEKKNIKLKSTKNPASFTPEKPKTPEIPKAA